MDNTLAMATDRIMRLIERFILPILSVNNPLYSSAAEILKERDKKPHFDFELNKNLYATEFYINSNIEKYLTKIPLYS